MEKKIDASLASGFRDYLPEDMITRQKMFDTIRGVFETFGFMPLDTPGLEREETLTGGDPNFRMHIFRASLQGGDDKLALRFDLTVPLARVISMYPELAKPFRRYQVGKVWRGERPQAGRFREFVQFDADIVGASSFLADAEILALMYQTMTALGVRNFLIKVNNRKILNGLSEFVGFEHALTPKVLRSIDKMDKIGWPGVAEELKKEGLSDSQLADIKQFVGIRGKNQEETLSQVRSLMTTSKSAIQGVEELEGICKHLKSFSIPDEAWTVDLSVARGLGYYTGPVFETILNDLPEIGSVFSGGRYDGLVERFSSQGIPATGASVGVDRLFAALDKLGLIKKIKTTSRVLVLNFDPESEDACIRVLGSLRAEGISSEIYQGKEASLRGQMNHAVKQEVPIVIILGSEERASGKAQVKNLRDRSQVEVPLENIPLFVSKILE